MPTQEIEGLFEGDVVVLSAPIDPADWDSLGPNEAGIVARATAKRRCEFATGRRLAREGLARLGVTNFEVLSDSSRAPKWPVGIAGSLAHSQTIAVAALGLRDTVGSLGIDAEERPELDPELWPLVLRPEEREGLKAWPAAERGRLALIVFSAKESLYKAQYPRSGQFMEFFDVHVEVVRTGGMIATVGEMVCRFRRDVGPFGVGAAFRGRFRELGADAGILTGVQIPATPHAHPVASG